MEGLTKQLSEKLGLAEGKAEQVGQFLKEHAAEVPGWLSTHRDQFLKAATEKAGLAKEQAEKLHEALKTHGAEWAHWLGGHSKEAMDKAKGALGGLFGQKK
jgi:hypothetical protein